MRLVAAAVEAEHSSDQLRTKQRLAPVRWDSITSWPDDLELLAGHGRERGHCACAHTSGSGMEFAIRRSDGIVLRCHHYAHFIVLVNIPCRKKARVYGCWFDKRTVNNYGGKPEKSSYKL